MNIVVMGATSHIAKSLIERFLHSGSNTLQLFARSADAVRQFLTSVGQVNSRNYNICDNYQRLPDTTSDIIINCIGVETRNSHNCDFTRYFTVTEEFDNLAINYLKNCNPDALYISFSSGAVYGKGFLNPVTDDSTNCIQVNNLSQQDYYSIVRINAEAKHRAHHDLRIIDLRIFSYFSRYINLTDGYFITDLIEAIQRNKVLQTDNSNIVRDYLHPDDLFSMINTCIHAGRINQSFDINSTSPISKQEILDFFTAEYGLQYESRHFSQNSSATGAKFNYYSICNHASQIGFAPKYSSLETVMQEAKHILKPRNT